jgi:hypothetical protein
MGETARWAEDEILDRKNAGEAPALPVREFDSSDEERSLSWVQCGEKVEVAGGAEFELA